MKPFSLLALLIFLGAATWVLTWSPSMVRKVQTVYYSAITPFLKGGSKIEKFSRDFVKEVEHSKNLERKLEAIQADYGELKIIEGRFRELERENVQLNRALGFQKRTPFQVKAAKVIKRRPSTWWDTITINRGEDSDVGPQLAVLAEGGLVGRTDLCYEDVANVLLITDEACQVSVYVEGSPEKGILSGEPGEFGTTPLLRLRYLSKNAAIQKGMKVFTTGRGNLFPPDIQVGTIRELLPGSYESEALVEPSVDLANLGVVFVLTGNTLIEEEEPVP
jgi:rod shape-determining protein MreC